ncbi:MAG: DegT/DnrJ/EryC1/StrS family aminotransferase [Chloroflexi bacterium]|jgi:dTDP-4-amino-4,6-dideoxygalactose transaminase|nr:MAG: DegT/DnrJ/EryC1/StrS family aminotransferase [Chloroflexota bacterium]
MQVPFGDFKRQIAPIRAELDQAIARVLDSGAYILGPEVRAFEAHFARYCQAQFCIGVANGTDAIQIALVALGVGVGDEVITVANTGVPGTAAIVALGAIPVFVDVDPTSRNMDATLIAAAITPRTKAIMPVHLYGLMADMPAILAVARAHHIPVVEDCAQAHGASINGQVAGSWGDVAAFSFYPSKNLGAIGDGGAITTNREDIALKVQRLRQYGWERKYFSTEPNGLNSRLDELQAVILDVKLTHLDAGTDRRNQIALEYNRQFADLPIQLPLIPTDNRVVHHLYVIQTPHRDNLLAQLKERGIGCDIHYPLPTHKQPIYQQYAPTWSLPVTNRLADEVLSLPNFPELTDAEVAQVVAVVRQVVSTLPA